MKSSARQHRKLAQDVAKLAEDVNYGLAYRENYSRLASGLSQLEQIADMDLPEVRQSLAVGMLALARTGRQLKLHPGSTVGHYERAGLLAVGCGERNLAAASFHGQAMALEDIDPRRSLKLMNELSAMYSGNEVSWWMRITGILRRFGDYDSALDVYRQYVNPLSRSLAQTSDGLLITDNSWAATLIECGRYLDEAYSALSREWPVADQLALYDRKILLTRFYMKVNEPRLAELTLQEARKLALANAYDPSAIARLAAQISSQ